MKILAILLLLVSTISCNITFPDSIASQYEENPFLSVYDISKQKNEKTELVSISNVQSINVDSIRFSIITDVHLGRDRDDSSVKYFHDNFYSYLDSDKPEFLVCLGDLTDDGQYDQNVKNFIDSTAERTKKGWFVYCIGNHERHIFDYAKWDEENAENSNGLTGWDLLDFAGTMGHYMYGNLLSIYKLDSSMRVLGKAQLSFLENALKSDRAKYKIIVAHDNMTTGGTFDQSLFLTGFADITERNKLYRIMSEYKIGLVLVGHHHKGNIEYRMNDYMGELNLAAYHQRKTPLMNLESEGYFYDAILDAKTGMITINGYLAEYTKDTSRKPDTSFSFRLPSSH